MYKDKEKYNEWTREYRKRPEIKLKRAKQIKIYMRERKRRDPIFRLRCNISSALCTALKENYIRKGGRKWEKLVGYTKQELKIHLESLFTEEMSWDNYGDWHVDHIVPLSFFKYSSTDDVEFKYAWSLDNLQPLWAEDNFSKSDSLLYNIIK